MQHVKTMSQAKSLPVVAAEPPLYPADNLKKGKGPETM